MIIGFLKSRKPRPPRRRPHRAFMAVTQLEMRLAPATLVGGINGVGATDVTYLDENRQQVDVHISPGVFDASTINSVFTFKSGSVNGSNMSAQQLQEIDLTQLANPGDASGATLTITVTSPGTAVPVEVGCINATGIDLGAVQVQGDLGAIYAGAAGTTTPGLASLTVQSMGLHGTTTQPPFGSLESDIQGPLGALTVVGDIDGAFINVSGSAGTIGQVSVGGSLRGGAGDYSGEISASSDVAGVKVGGSLDGGAGYGTGAIVAGGNLGPVTIGGSVLGAAGADSGSISATGNLTSVTVDGSLEGSTGLSSGQILAGGTLGAVQIGVAAGSGNVVGAAGEYSGSIFAGGNLASVTLVGSLEGGAGVYSGGIGTGFTTSNVGPVTIGGNVVGSGGFDSGSIFAPGSLGNVTVVGSLEGGAGVASGTIVANVNMGQVTIGKGVQGAAGEYSGSILAGGTMAALAGETVKVVGSLAGGAGNYSGEIVDNGYLGPVIITGNLQGFQGSGGQYSGEVGSHQNSVAGVTVGGSVIGGAGGNSGEIFANASTGILGPVQITGNLKGGSISGTQSLANSGYIFGARITSVSITGSVIAGTNTGTGKLTNSGAIRATYDIGPITVGNLMGNSKNPVVISASGVASPGTTDLAIASITVGDIVNKKVVSGTGNVSFTNILAGYNPAGIGVNAAAQIGPVTVYGNWTASNLVAGAGPGPDGQFGTGDDVVLGTSDAPNVMSQIGAIIITGTVVDVNNAVHYGFVAQKVTSLSVDGKPPITLTQGVLVPVDTSGKVNVYEL